MTSAIASSSSYTILSALAQAAQTRAQQSQTLQLALIDNQIQNQLNTKIAALQATPANSTTDVLQADLTNITNTKNTLTSIESGYSSNSTVIADLQTQLASLNSAAQNGDSTGFDQYLAAANTDVADLQIVSQNPVFQPDGVEALKNSGLGISSSSTYDLSTTTGQAAAEAAVSAAVQTVNQVQTTTGDNITVASSSIDALASQYDTYNTQLQSLQSSQDTDTQTQITNLTNQAQTQEHLIELALGNSQALAASLLAQENPPSPATSAFGVLENAVGQTATTYQQQATADASSPSILSLFA